MFAWVGGAFRKTRPQVLVLGSFRQVRNVYALVGGAWRPTWSYRWESSGWSGCNVSCGGGTQTRTVRCLRNDGVEMPDTFCSQAGSKPSTSQSCNTQSCYSYRWSYGGWGSCSASCGYGTRYRSVWCERNDGVKVGDSYCGSGKPSTSESCNAGTCVTYRWATGAYGDCSTTCGSGTKTRSVYCAGSNGNSYSDSFCSGQSKPATSQACSSCMLCKYDYSGAYLTNKLKHVKATGNGGSKVCPSLGIPANVQYWSTSDLQKQIISCEGMTLSGHFITYGRSEGVCPYYGAQCCKNEGYKYY